jgi:hypothetical protein
MYCALSAPDVRLTRGDFVILLLKPRHERLILPKDQFEKLAQNIIPVAVQVLAIVFELRNKARFKPRLEPFSGEFGLSWNEECHGFSFGLFLPVENFPCVGGSDRWSKGIAEPARKRKMGGLCRPIPGSLPPTQLLSLLASPAPNGQRWRQHTAVALSRPFGTRRVVYPSINDPKKS